MGRSPIRGTFSILETSSGPAPHSPRWVERTLQRTRRDRGSRAMANHTLVNPYLPPLNQISKITFEVVVFQFWLPLCQF
jgi:hypothetical protein